MASYKSGANLKYGTKPKFKLAKVAIG